MTVKALGNRVRRLERQHRIGDLSQLSEDELWARADEILMLLPKEIRDVLEPHHEEGDIAALRAETRRILLDPAYWSSDG